jgi:hypothetical protein
MEAENDLGRVKAMQVMGNKLEENGEEGCMKQVVSYAIAIRLHILHLCLVASLVHQSASYHGVITL